MRIAGLKRATAVISVAIACATLLVTLGLIERASRSVDALRDVVGRNTWWVRQVEVIGAQPSGLPRDPASLEGLRTLTGVRNLALETSAVQALGTGGYAVIGVSTQYFAVKRLRFQAGRAFAARGEAVVGSRFAALLGQTVTGGFSSYRVVGVLESVSSRGGLDSNADSLLFLPLEGYSGFAPEVTGLYLEMNPANFDSGAPALRAWLEARGLNRSYEVVPLAAQYGVELRERVSRLLAGALGFGLIAVIASAGANLGSYFFTRSLERAREVGVRRAVGASAGAIVLEELTSSVPLAALGAVVGAALAAVVIVALQGGARLDATPGPLAFVATVLGIVGLAAIAALLPAIWSARLTPSAAVRGTVGGLPQRQLMLAGVGLGIGVAALVLQSSSAASTRQETERLIGRFQERVGIYAPSFLGGDSFGDPRAAVQMTARVYDALLESDTGRSLARTAFARSIPLTMNGPAGDAYATVRAYEGDLIALAGPRLASGRWPEDTAAEVVLGEGLARKLFGATNPVGARLELFGRPLAVVGVFVGGTSRGVSSEEALVPGGIVRVRGVGFIFAEVKADADLDTVLQAGADFINQRFGQQGMRPIAPLRPSDIAPPVRAALEELTLAYRVLSAVLLALGCVGLTAQLFVALGLRAPEFAVRRAMGASVGDVFVQVIGEIFRLALTSGTVGAAVGVALAWVAASAQGVTFALDGVWLPLAVLTGIVIALVAASPPALSAALVPPAQTMRERA